MKIEMAGKLFLSLLILFSFGRINANGIPAILWTNKPNVQYPVLLRGPALGSKDFTDGFLEQIVEKGDQNLAVFIQDELSLNDITNYADVFNDKSDGAVFSSLKGIMENYESTHIAKVITPVYELKKLQRKFKGKVHIVENIQELDNVKLEENTANMMVINLPKSDHLNRGELLKRSDDVIGKVTNRLSKKKMPFAAVYTANEATKFVPFGRAKMGRHLLAADEATASTNSSEYTFFKVGSSDVKNGSSCVFFYTTSFKFQVLQISKTVGPNYEDHTIYDFPALKSDTSGMTANSNCFPENGTAQLMVDYKDHLPMNLTKFSMTMNFHTMYGYWTIKNWTLSFAGQNKTNSKMTFNETNWSMDTTPTTLYGTTPYANPSSHGYSYHCGEQTITQTNSTIFSTTDLVVRLLITDFQLQYNITSGMFGPPNDCIGFFSGAIWMTIIFALLAISILAFGMGLLSSIQTMDRFDDPKGKTIQVNVNE